MSLAPDAPAPVSTGTQSPDGSGPGATVDGAGGPLHCSGLARALDEPLGGTAPSPRAWLAVEQPGPWGRKAPSTSRLDAAIGARLDATAKEAGVTLVLVRRPGRDGDAERDGSTGPLTDASPASRRVFLAAGGVVHETVVDSAEALLDLDLTALAAGTPPAGRPVEGGLLLVCTNGRRDVCCALRGRPLAAELTTRFPGRVWESSHLGGHRFSPTVLSLPDGYVFGGPGAGGLDVAACRGRSSLSRPAQAAELAVLRALGVAVPFALEVTPAPDADDAWLVTPPGGTTLRVTVGRRTLSSRLESCGKDAVDDLVAWEALDLAPC